MQNTGMNSTSANFKLAEGSKVEDSPTQAGDASVIGGLMRRWRIGQIPTIT